jgi:ribonuclease-3
MPTSEQHDSIEQNLSECEASIQYQFRNRDLLEHCLTHSSVARTRLASNERLEFLGDAILGALVCEMLFHRFPEYPEGELTRIKSSLVSRLTCAEIADELGVDRLLFLGKGLHRHDGIPVSIKAAVYETLIAGIYLDGGLQAVGQFVEQTMASRIEQLANAEQSKNFKSLLQQLSQKNFGGTPVYRLLDEKGPDHSKCFKISAVIGPRKFTAAWGPSKKEAEQRAAHNALFEMEGKEVPWTSD